MSQEQLMILDSYLNYCMSIYFINKIYGKIVTTEDFELGTKIVAELEQSYGEFPEPGFVI